MSKKINEFEKIDFSKNPATKVNLLTDMLSYIAKTKRPDESNHARSINTGLTLTILYVIVEDALYFNEGRNLCEEIDYKINVVKKIPDLFKDHDIKHNNKIGVLEIIEYFEYIIKNTTAMGNCLREEMTNGRLEEAIYRLYNLVYPISARLKKD